MGVDDRDIINQMCTPVPVPIRDVNAVCALVNGNVCGHVERLSALSTRWVKHFAVRRRSKYLFGISHHLKKSGL
jgi:hypothetical protein